ncbi:ATP-dependent Clp protease adaptor ClpS, partial [Pasteurella multocida]|uniref:ATP-dependent Clp protease adaptor ClpS n=1 Tax=Pasteurella multocida TaxID=747 RepID=UPI0035E43110
MTVIDDCYLTSEVDSKWLCIMGKTNDWLDFDQLAEDKVRDALKPPSMYKVMLMNDDYTPMEFVIDVL